MIIFVALSSGSIILTVTSGHSTSIKLTSDRRLSHLMKVQMMFNVKLNSYVNVRSIDGAENGK